MGAKLNTLTITPVQRVWGHSKSFNKVPTWKKTYYKIFSVMAIIYGISEDVKKFLKNIMESN